MPELAPREAGEAAEIPLQPTGRGARNCEQKSPELKGQGRGGPGPGWVSGAASPSCSPSTAAASAAQQLPRPAAPHPRRLHSAERQLHLPLALDTLRSQLHSWATSAQALRDRDATS